MTNKHQVPVLGGLRKVIRTGSDLTVGTTIAEIGAQTITLAQLAALIGDIQKQNDNPGTPVASIALGPGLSGGGPVVGVVPIRLDTLPTVLFDAGGGSDSGGGTDGFMIPGVPGARGLPGQTIVIIPEDGEDGMMGAPAPIVAPVRGLQGPPGFDGDNGEDALMIPGPQGIQGIQGIPGTGGTGSSTVIVAAGDDGEDGLWIPGQQGLRGLQGCQGATGLEGDSGEDALMIPGPPGSASGGTPAAPSTSVQFNNGGVFGGSANFEWNGTGVVIKSDNTGLQINSLTTAGYSYINMANQAGTRELEFLFIGSAATPVYGGAAGDSVINVNSGTLWLSTTDTGRVSVSHAGNVVVAAPTSGTAVVINGVAAANALIVNAAVGAVGVINSTNAGGGYLTWQSSGTSIGDIGAALANLGFGTNADMSINVRGANSFYLATNTVKHLVISPTGTSTFFGPNGGTAIISDSGNTVSLTNYLIAASGTTLGQWGIGMDASDVFTVSRIDVAHTALQITLAGNVTIPSPTSGTTLALNLAGDGTGIGFLRAGVLEGQIGFGNAFVAGQYEIFSQGTAISLGIGTSGSAVLNVYTNSVNRLNIGTSGAVTINAPSAVVTGLTVNGAANANTVVIIGAATANQSFGLDIQAGTSASDYNLFLQTHAGGTILEVFGNGGMVMAAATGGNQGLGTINATGLFVNGVAVGVGTTIGVSFNGTSTPTIINHVGTGTTSVSRSSAGHYTVSWAPGFSPSVCTATLTTPTAAGVVMIDAFSSTTCQITTANLAGTAVDLNSTVQIIALR